MKHLSILLLFALCACTSTSQSLKQMYADSIRERSSGVFTSMEHKYQERQEERFEKVRRYLAEEQLASAEDFLYAGALLAASPQQEDLLTAQMAGLRAAQMGEDKGFRVAAEAIDRHAMHLGNPQRYGTQYYYEEVLRKWRLYAVDPKTTDAERKAMGVEPLAELYRKTELLNENVR